MSDIYYFFLGLQIVIGEALSPPWLYMVVLAVLGGMLLYARFAPGNYIVPMITAIIGAIASSLYAVELWSRGAGWRGFSEISDYEIRTIGPYILTAVFCIAVAVASNLLDRPRARQRQQERKERVSAVPVEPQLERVDRMFCSKCGTESNGEAQFCSKCGQSLTGAAPAATEPVVINGVTYTPGTGPFAGLYAFPGGGWVTIENGQIRKAGASGRGSGLSSGRIIAAVVCFVVGGFALLQSLSWFDGFADLDADGNPFAGALVPLALGALAVGAGFVVWGIVLVSRKH